MLRTKYLAIAAGLTLAGSIAVAGPASASSTGCAFSNGCATLHGTDAAGNDVAMDAKYQNKSEILIGYPDNTGDNATSFDGVLHYTHTRSVTTWDDSELKQFAADAPVYANQGSATPIKISGSSYDAATGTWNITVTGGTGPYTAAISGLSDSGSAASVTSPITESSGSYNAAISVNGDTLAPGVYDDITLTITDSATPVPQSVSYTAAARVVAHSVTIPGGNEPFYTFVYAPHGDWTSQCVTDINGSGALKLYPCTEGREAGQDFTIGSTGGLLDGSQNHVSNLLAAAAGASSCLTDPSTSNALAGQSDAADEVAPGGRQLYVNGSCAAGANLWSWGT